MEFFIGGMGACGACLLTNPLEVIKTRMQLQGELKARGLYTVHYRNVFHAFYAVGKADGIFALQKGLVPALWYQLFMNSIRLGCYQCFINLGWTRNSKGEISIPRSAAAGAISGIMGASVGSPWYLIKTHLQSQSVKEVAVGHQHRHQGTYEAVSNIYHKYGVKGLWRGVTGAIPRVSMGSATQLPTFTKAREVIDGLQILPPGSWRSLFLASCVSGVVVVIFMTPFDVVSTRLYNQGVDANGRGLFYSGFMDCFVKIFTTEGLLGFYKGISASFLRLGPHTVLSLVLWSKLRIYSGLDKKHHVPETKLAEEVEVA